MAAKKAASKKAAPAKKKAPIDYPKGASTRAKNAQSDRMEKQALENRRTGQPKRGNNAAAERLSEYERKNRGAVYQGEGGFYSTGLANKADREYAAYRAQQLKIATQQMKQGVTKSGGYANMYPIQSVRKANRSDKFKGEQAVKKSGGSMTRNTGNKKKNAK